MLKEGIKTFKFIKEFKKFKSAENDIVRKRALNYLKELLKTEGGILTKFLQYTGTNPKEIEEIQDLSQQVLEGIPVEDIKEILIDNFQEKALDIQNISDFAIAASVGQVHFATYKEEKIAIKIQYPKIKETFIEQLRLLKVLPTIMEVSSLKKWGMDISMYQRKLQSLIEQECDYKQEAEQLVKWNNYLKEIPNCNVPTVFNNFSNEYILTQSFVEGVLVDELKHWQKSEKIIVGKALIYAYFEVLFKHHEI